MVNGYSDNDYADLELLPGLRLTDTVPEVPAQMARAIAAIARHTARALDRLACPLETAVSEDDVTMQGVSDAMANLRAAVLAAESMAQTVVFRAGVAGSKRAAKAAEAAE